MSLCIVSNLNQLITAINDIESHIGIDTATDTTTVNGRIYNLQNNHNVDGGSSTSTYLSSQNLDGGGA